MFIGGSRGLSVTFQGVRGSTPCHGDDIKRYGGNTSCVSVDVPDEPPIIFDLGTGLRYFGMGQAHDGTFRANCLLTHLHWDHTQGLPFFTPMLRDGAELDVYAPAQDDGRSVADVFASIIHPPLFPVTLDQFPGTFRFHDCDDTEFDLGPGSTVAVPALTVHGFTFSTDVEGVVVTLLERDLVAIDLALPAATVIREDTAAIADALARLTAEADDPGSRHDLAMRAHVTLLLLALQRSGGRPASGAAGIDRTRRHAEAFRRLVDRQFRQTRRVADYARQIGISHTHLNRICRQLLGASAQGVIERRVALEARRQLQFSTLSIKQIGAENAGAELGFFFYAGHGLQTDGVNYALPADIDPTQPDFLRNGGISIGDVIGDLRDLGVSKLVVVLDACRNSPFGATAAHGTEHLSSVRESYLKGLASETGLTYAHLDDIHSIARSLPEAATPRPLPGRLDLRPLFSAAALALLIVLFAAPLLVRFSAPSLRSIPEHWRFPPNQGKSS